uniref:Arsenate reductase (Glutaredoxin) n=2 Tax=Candidatus Kentrum sp. LPFa TaxID=2126335 RepID=A0A450WUM4_9GAMM|nr:MAG: arsenate reductase (glutaredoxin) [Candidatus Kentron sp. LPFa]
MTVSDFFDRFVGDFPDNGLTRTSGNRKGCRKCAGLGARFAGPQSPLFKIFRVTDYRLPVRFRLLFTPTSRRRSYFSSEESWHTSVRDFHPTDESSSRARCANRSLARQSARNKREWRFNHPRGAGVSLEYLGNNRIIFAMKTTIYHNPRCSKSRGALQMLKDRHLEVEIIEYLKNPPSEQELDRILTKLGMEPRELMRRKEAPYKAKGLNDKGLDRAALIRAMVEDPILIERPIVSIGDKTALGRPLDNVARMLEETAEN